MLNFIHATGFDDDWADMGLDDEDLWIAQFMIQFDPTRSPVVKGTGGLRKLRFATRRKTADEKLGELAMPIFRTQQPSF